MQTTALRGAASSVLATGLLLAATTGCGPRHHLADYNFAGQTMALVVINPPAPLLLEGSAVVQESDNLLTNVTRAGVTMVANAEAGRARARLDSAAARVPMAQLLSDQTLPRSSRYLGMRPVESPDDADFLLEVHMRSVGIDARGHNAATLFTNAEVVLLDRYTGREIWNLRVRGSDRLTPRIRSHSRIPGAVVAAGTLHLVAVEDFEDALDQLMLLSANVISDRLRSSLRDVRR